MLQSALELFSLAPPKPAFPDAPVPAPEEPASRAVAAVPSPPAPPAGRSRPRSPQRAARSLRGAAGHRLSFRRPQSEPRTWLRCTVTTLVKRVSLSPSPSFPSSSLFPSPRQPSPPVLILPRPLSLSPACRKPAAVQMSCDPVSNALCALPAALRKTNFSKMSTVSFGWTYVLSHLIILSVKKHFCNLPWVIWTLDERVGL